MSDYSPSQLAAKWKVPLSQLREECQSLWEAGRPRKPWLRLGLRDPEADGAQDQMIPRKDRMILGYEGHVVMGHFARAFFPAYIPGSQTHYGSVVYSSDPFAGADVFELAWRVNQLRERGRGVPAGAEEAARAICDDQSNFSSLELPAVLGGKGKGRFGNICIHRGRLPLGYLHTRLVPILIEPRKTRWSCVLPLRFWSPGFSEIWKSGPPCYPQEQFVAQCRTIGIES